MKAISLLVAVGTLFSSCFAVGSERNQQKDAELLGRHGDFAPALVNLFLITGYPHSDDDRFRSSKRIDAASAVWYWLGAFSSTLEYTASTYADHPELFDRSPLSREVRFAKYFWRLESLALELTPDMIAQGKSVEEIEGHLATIKASLATLELEYEMPDTRWFSDVPEDHWADFAIHKLRRAGILYGYPDGKFRM